MNSIRLWLASKLAPEMARDAERGNRLVTSISIDRWWLSEFPAVFKTMEWILHNAADHYRALGEPASNPYPSQIHEFRETLRRQHPEDRATLQPQGDPDVQG